MHCVVYLSLGNMAIMSLEIMQEHIFKELTYLLLIFYFCTPWKRQKIVTFSVVFREYRNVTLEINVLKKWFYLQKTKAIIRIYWNCSQILPVKVKLLRIHPSGKDNALWSSRFFSYEESRLLLLFFSFLISFRFNIFFFCYIILFDLR